MSKLLRRFPPCPVYRIQALEAWLQDMARDGWQLDSISNLWGYFRFRQTTPQTVHYRLDATSKRQSWWNGDDASQPAPEALSLHAEFGWEFVAHYQGCFLYRSTESHPRELHTDPEIQAMTLKALNRRILWSLLYFLLITGLQVIFGVFGFPLAIAMAMGSLFVVSLAILLLMQIVNQLQFMIHIHRYCVSLEQPTNSRQDSNWKNGKWKYQILFFTSWFLSAVILITGITGWVRNRQKPPLDQCDRETPFVTLQQLAPEDSSATLSPINNGYFTVWADPLFPEVWQWLDGGSVRYEDGTDTAGLLDIQYCQAITPWLAQAAARDFTRFYQLQGRVWDDEHTVTPLPGLGLDYAIGFYNQFGLIRVVLAEDNQMVCCRLSMDDSKGNYCIENWVSQMVNQMLEEQEDNT